MREILRRVAQVGLTVRAAGLALLCAACFAPAPEDAGPRTSYFIGVDVSGSFERTGGYDDALAFAAHYIHAHLNGRGDLQEPRALFVGAVGGDAPGQTQGFHPIHDFQGKSIPEIEADLSEWFPPNDLLTDFNTFFQRVATLAKRHNLVLGPIDMVVLTDGIPDVGAGMQPVDSPEELYTQIDFDPLEYLARNVTVRLLYPDPDIAANWERRVERSRVRLWTVDRVVMQGWREQLRMPEPPSGGTEAVDMTPTDSARAAAIAAEAADPPRASDPDAAPQTTAAEPVDPSSIAQPDLWKWIADNVDFRVRRGVL